MVSTYSLELYNLIMISKNTVKRFCCDNIANIENYDKAITDNN